MYRSSAEAEVAVEGQRVTSATPVESEPTRLGLITFAKKHRYRLRNLHDGNPVPPAIHKGPIDKARGYWGREDRCDAIVGRNGYAAMDGDNLSVTLFFGSSKGVNKAIRRLREFGGRVDQIGDTEVGATVPVERIEEVLGLFKVSKLRPPNRGSFRPGTKHLLGPGTVESRKSRSGAHST